MATADITLTTADGPMRVYEATPDGEARGAVIVIQEAFGVNAHIEDVTRRVAAAGYRAAAPELFHRSGERSLVPYDDVQQAIGFIQQCSDDTILMDVDATIAHLNAQGFTNDRIGIVGFCMGGRVTFLTAVRRSIGAAVGYYGGMIVSSPFPAIGPLIGEAGSLKTPWLGIFGDQDQGIPISDVEKLTHALKDADVAHDVILYPGADHGFNCDDRAVHHPEAAADAWPRALAWFQLHLGRPG
jgi:carboxymethylenebutenolidase